MLTIDGSQGEGGGQILRTALALSIVTGAPFELTRIRAGRDKPGLLRQHLTAVRAAAEISSAEVQHAELHSRRLTFAPRAVQQGEYTFDVGSAGSCTLVLQTILPPLLLASGETRLTLVGGTHNPHAPPFDFLADAFLPLVRRMGPNIDTRLVRHGFFPRGGGRLEFHITPTRRLQPITLNERGQVTGRSCTAIIAGLPRHIADREVKTAARTLDWPAETLRITEAPANEGPGNAVIIRVESEHVTEVFTGFGSRGIRAEDVAGSAAAAAQEYLLADVPVSEHLADQLLIPLALAGGGSFDTLPPSSHTRTNVDIIRLFLNVGFRAQPLSEHHWRIEVGPASDAAAGNGNGRAN